MKPLTQSLLLICIIFMVGCGGGSKTVHVVPPPVNYTPELRSFDMLDSYDVDTRVDDHTPLALSPYYYGGLFEVYWSANSLEDYVLELRINDRTSPNDSYLVHSERCGAGLWCDQAGTLICEYTSDFAMACEGEELIDVSELFPNVPEELYLILQVCDIDSAYCEYDYYPVWME